MMELCIYYETTYKTTHCMHCRLKMTWQCMRPPIRLDHCTCPNRSGIIYCIRSKAMLTTPVAD